MSILKGIFRLVFVYVNKNATNSLVSLQSHFFHDWIVILKPNSKTKRVKPVGERVIHFPYNKDNQKTLPRTQNVASHSCQVKVAFELATVWGIYCYFWDFRITTFCCIWNHIQLKCMFPQIFFQQDDIHTTTFLIMFFSEQQILHHYEE